MGHSKTVKINLKQLIADLIFAFSDKDENAIKDVKSKFEEVYSIQNTMMKNNIIKYLLSNKVVLDNKKLYNYFVEFQK